MSDALTYCVIATNNRYIDDVFVLLSKYSIIVCQIGPELECREYEDLDEAIVEIEKLAGDDVSLSCHTPR